MSHENKKTELSCLMINACSLVNNLDLFQSIIFKYNPDIIGITETWCSSAILDLELQLTGYELFRCDLVSIRKVECCFLSKVHGNQQNLRFHLPSLIIFSVKQEI